MLDQWLGSSLARIKNLPNIPQHRFPPSRLHTFYGGAHLFHAKTLNRLQIIAQEGMNTFFPTPEHLADWYACVVAPWSEQYTQEGQMDLPELIDSGLSQQLHECLVNRIQSFFIEDYRIDFEDGFGIHSEQETVAQARRTAKELGVLLLEGKKQEGKKQEGKKQEGKKLAGKAVKPQAGQEALRNMTALGQFPHMGIRLKPLEKSSAEQAITILYEFMATLTEQLSGQLRQELSSLPCFWVTIPKCQHPQEVSLMLTLLQELEDSLGLAVNTLGIEIMFESLGAIMAFSQTDFLERWLPHRSRAHSSNDLVKGARPTALVLGTYDTCAQWGVFRPAQGHAHPLMDWVRLQACGWGRQVGVPVIDSITRAVPSLKGDQRPLVLHARHVLHSMSLGVETGWDIHPLQSLARHAITIVVAGLSLPQVLNRLASFEAAQSHASRVGAGFDDLATVRALFGQVNQALGLGLLTEEQLVQQGISWPPKWL